MSGSWGWPFSKGYVGYFEEGQQFGITSYYRPGGTYFHDGFDFGSAIYGQGSEILAVNDGEVIYTGVMGSGLGSVIVLSIPPYQVMYQEFSTSTADIYVQTGSRVSKGQAIGRLNASHLHLGITEKDWNTALGSWNVDDGTWLNPISILSSSGSGSPSNTYDPKTMKTSQRGFELIRSFEGLSLEAYQDQGGVWTIGYGHTQGVTPGMVITQLQANDLLSQDIAQHEVGVGRYVTVPLTQNQFDALSSFVFNLGVNILAGSDLLNYINTKQWQAAADEMKKYVHVGSAVSVGLVNRRNKEVQLFLDFSGSGEVTKKGEIEMQALYQVDGKGAVYYFDGEQVRALTHPDEMKVLQDIYKENNDKDMPFFNWTSSVPWHYRLKGILQRPKEF
ncbi:TPA: glycoside hydrolase family protein [Enterococcus faecium]